MAMNASARRAALPLGAAAAALALAAPAVAQAPAPSTQELLDQIRLLQKRIEQLEAAEKQRQAADPKVRTAAQQPAAPPRPRPRPSRVCRLQGSHRLRSQGRRRQATRTSRGTAASCWAP